MHQSWSQSWSQAQGRPRRSRRRKQRRQQWRLPRRAAVEWRQCLLGDLMGLMDYADMWLFDERMWKNILMACIMSTSYCQGCQQVFLTFDYCRWGEDHRDSTFNDCGQHFWLPSTASWSIVVRCIDMRLFPACLLSILRFGGPLKSLSLTMNRECPGQLKNCVCEPLFQNENARQLNWFSLQNHILPILLEEFKTLLGPTMPSLHWKLSRSKDWRAQWQRHRWVCGCRLSRRGAFFRAEVIRRLWHGVGMHPIAVTEGGSFKIVEMH